VSTSLRSRSISSRAPTKRSNQRSSPLPTHSHVRRGARHFRQGLSRAASASARQRWLGTGGSGLFIALR
jgi:hypothetical protein